MADEQPDSAANAAQDATQDAPQPDDAAPTVAQDIPQDMAQDTEPDATGVARVAALEAQVAELQQQIERERDQATEYMRHWHTAQADFANFKRRAQQEQEQRERLLAAQALAPTLNALDSLERAFLALPVTLRSYTWIEGIALVELQLRRALELQGIRAVAAEPGQAFDPTRHEPIGEVETTEYDDGAIAVVAQAGYESQGLLIRPALVQLARKPGASPAATPSSADTADDTADDTATEATSST